MKILLYNPDNGVTRNFMPHLWMFLLQSLTPEGHEVVLIDGNAKAMTNDELVRFCREEKVGLVGIGSMTRMVARAYKVADALRDAGFNTLIAGQWTDRTQEAATMTWVRETFTALEPYAGLRKFVTISARTKRPAPRQSPSMVRIWRGSGTEAQI